MHYMAVFAAIAVENIIAMRRYRAGEIEYKDLPGACVRDDIGGIIRRCRL